MVPRGAFLLLAVSAIWLSGCVRPAASDPVFACSRARGICVPKKLCGQPVPNAACDNEGRICCRRGFLKTGRTSARGGNGNNNQDSKKVGGKRCTEKYGTCRHGCPGAVDSERNCPDGKICCKKSLKIKNKKQISARGRDNDCTAAGGTCNDPTSECKEKLPIECPDATKNCCKRTKNNTCKSKGFRCVNKCGGNVKELKGCKEGKVCCDRAKKNNCKSLGGSCRVESKCTAEVLNPTRKCRNNKICCKKGETCRKLGGNCRKEFKCNKNKLNPSIPCKDGKVCCERGETCRKLGGNCRIQSKCNGNTITPSIPCKDGKVCCGKGNKCKDLGGTCREQAKCNGDILTPSIPCKGGKACCEKGKKCKALGGTCREEAKCNGNILTPSIPCKGGKACCEKGKKCKALGGTCREGSKCNGEYTYSF
nr:granulins-like [Penaeus vannamei]